MLITTAHLAARRLFYVLLASALIVGCDRPQIDSPMPESTGQMEEVNEAEEVDEEDISLEVTIDHSEIRFSSTAVELEDGFVSSDARRPMIGGASYVIPLHEALQAAAGSGGEFSDPVALRVEAVVPARSLVEVIHTMSQTSSMPIEWEVDALDDLTQPAGYGEIARESAPETGGGRGQRLHLAVAADGIYISPSFATLNEATEEGVPTVAMVNDDADIEEMSAQARAAMQRGDTDEASRLLHEIVEAYDLMEVYNQLRILKNEYSEETRISILSEHFMPVAVLDWFRALSRATLTEESYEDRDKFWTALTEEEPAEAMFPDINFSIMR